MFNPTFYSELEIISELPPRMNPEINYITLTDFSKIYDLYTINLEGFEFYTISEFSSIEKLDSLHTVF